MENGDGEMSNDDEIRESIPCVTLVLNSECLCIPAGYTFVPGFGIVWRGAVVPGTSSWRDAWDHAIAREKARRERDGQASATDKATVMLAEVIRERDGLLTMLEDERGVSISLRMERDELKAKLADVTKDRNELLLENDDLRSERDKAEEKEKVMAAAFGVAVYERDELRKGVEKGNETPTEVARNSLSVDLSSEHNVIKRNFDTPVTIQIQGVLEQVRDDFYSSIEALERDSISAYIDGVEKGLNDIETAFVVNSQLCESRRQKIEELTRELSWLLNNYDDDIPADRIAAIIEGER
jgi:hypothetical protein